MADRTPSRWRASRDRMDGICGSAPDVKTLRIRVIGELQKAVGFDAYAWLLTDPETCVGVAPLAHVPNLPDLPHLIRSKYLTTVNRWTTLPTDRAVTLAQSTQGRLDRSRLWRDLLSRYGVADVASMVFRDPYGCWGFLDLWRVGAAPPLGNTPDLGSVRRRFDLEEQAFLSGLLPRLTTALRLGVAATFQPSDEPTPGRGGDHPTGPRPPSSRPDQRHDAEASGSGADAVADGPAVLMLAPDLRMVAQTPHTDAYLRALLPPDGQASPVPAAAYNVAAQLLALEEGIDPHPPTARVHLTGRQWLTLRAARLSGSIVVGLDTTTPTDRVGLFAAATGLSARESELLQRMLGGGDTHHLAQQMRLSEHTIQDHLKSIFAKTGTRTRRSLIAQALGT